MTPSPPPRLFQDLLHFAPVTSSPSPHAPPIWRQQRAARVIMVLQQCWRIHQADGTGAFRGDGGVVATGQEDYRERLSSSIWGRYTRSESELGGL